MRRVEQRRKDLVVLVADIQQQQTVRRAVSTISGTSEPEQVPRRFFSSLP